LLEASVAIAQERVNGAGANVCNGEIELSVASQISYGQTRLVPSAVGCGRLKTPIAVAQKYGYETEQIRHRHIEFAVAIEICDYRESGVWRTAMVDCRSERSIAIA